MKTRWHKRKRKKKKQTKERSPFVKQLVVGLGLFILLALLLWGTWHLSRVESMTIKEVVVLGGETISEEEIREMVEEELSGTYLKIIPKRFALTYPRDGIKSKLLSVHKIENVEVERIDWQSIGVAFTEYIPVALWCEQNRLSEDCYFLDKDGLAFAAAPPLRGAAFVRYAEVGEVPERGKYLFDRKFLSETDRFIEEAYRTLNLNIVYVEKSGEFDVTYEFSGGGQVKTNLEMSTEETLENLETILFSDDFSHLEPGNFQYIDLRFGNKVFVNEAIISEAATSTATSSNFTDLNPESTD